MQHPLFTAIPTQAWVALLNAYNHQACPAVEWREADTSAQAGMYASNASACEFRQPISGTHHEQSLARLTITELARNCQHSASHASIQ